MGRGQGGPDGALETCGEGGPRPRRARPLPRPPDLVDPVAYPRKEVVALYHERWEIELGYNEVKTAMLEREEAVRSQTPTRLPGAVGRGARGQPHPSRTRTHGG